MGWVSQWLLCKSQFKLDLTGTELELSLAKYEFCSLWKVNIGCAQDFPWWWFACGLFLLRTRFWRGGRNSTRLWTPLRYSKITLVRTTLEEAISTLFTLLSQPSWIQVIKAECPFLERTSLEWIYIGPVLLLLATNAFILVSIFYVVVTKLRSSGQGEPADHQNWKAAKALLVIIPLLGITYLITILGKQSFSFNNFSSITKKSHSV